MSTLALLQEPESHFLPGTKIQWAWDSTSLGDFKRCAYYYYLTHILGWTPKDESVHLRFGIEYHLALQNYDKLRAQGLNHEDALVEVVRELLYSTRDWDPDVTTKAGASKNRRSLLYVVVCYLDHYQDDKAITYIRPDNTPAVELSFRFELNYGPEGWDQPYLLCGHLDKIVVFNDEIFGKDYKTTNSPLTDYYFAQYEPNNQMSFYTLATKVVFDANVKGIIVDAAQLAKDKPEKPNFARRFTYRSSDQLEEWTRDLAYWLRLAERCAREDNWPRNDMSCDKYGGCRFREICNKSPQVRERFLTASFIQLPENERWNPLKTR